MRLVYTKPVVDRIAEIEDYFTLQSSAKKAEELIARLLSQAYTLLDHPFRGMPEKYMEHRGKGHRSLIVDRYKVIYYVEDDAVHITDFFDMKQHRSRMRG